MKYDYYVSLIQRLEKFAADHRRSYEFRLFLLTCLGYAYFIGLIILFFIPILFVAGILFVAPGGVAKVLLYTAKIWWALIPGLGVYFGFIGSALRSITARVPDPEGRELLRADAPDLFEFVDETCKSLKAQRPARVLVIDSFNAAVVTMPRFGIFGRKVILLVGLPLMKALSPDQFKAALAHEIGHISGKHGVFTKWAYQMRDAWGRLIDSQAVANHKFASLYKGFVDWFFPYFTAYSFVLMREHEKDADRDAAQLIGPVPLGGALIMLETKGRDVDEVFWREIHEENISDERPPEQLFSRMLGSLALINEERATAALSKAITVPTDLSDTHPSLADRLRLIGYWKHGDLPPQPGPVTIDAASEFLKNGVEKFAAEFDRTWDEHAAKEWKTRHNHFRESQKRIEELHAKISADDLTREDILELAERQAEKDGFIASLPIMLVAAEKFPDDPVILYNLGGMRLSLDDEQGLEDLNRAIELDKNYKLAASDLAFNFLRSKGRLDDARPYAVYIDEQNEVLDKAQKERQAVFPNDNFGAHALPEEFIEKIPEKLVGFDEIIGIYAVRKIVEYMPEIPFHVLFIELRKKGRIRNRHDLDPSQVLKLVLERLDTGEIHFFATLTANFAGTKYYLDAIPGAKVYSKK